MYKGSSLSPSWPALVRADTLGPTSLAGMKWFPAAVLTCVFLVVNDVEHLHTCLLATFYYKCVYIKIHEYIIHEYVYTCIYIHEYVKLKHVTVKTSVLDGLFSPLRGDHTPNTSCNVLFRFKHVLIFYT